MKKTASGSSFFNDYYDEKLKKYAPSSAEAVGWSEYLQQRLFDDMVRIIEDKNHASILDVGCGLGHFADYLSSHGYCTYDYTGIDIIDEMIRRAEVIYPDHLFLRGNFLTFPFFRSYDYVFCSGTLNIKTHHPFLSQPEFIAAFISKLYRLADRGCAFNLLSREGRDYFPDSREFYYADTAFIEKICRRLSSNVALLYNEGDFAFTVYMKK